MFSEFNSWLFYLGVLSGSAYLLGFISQTQKKKTFFYFLVTFIALALPILMAAYRSCGTDTFEYMRNYIYTRRTPIKEVFENISGLMVKTKNQEYKIESRNRKENNKEFFVNGKTASEAAFNAVAEIIGGIKINSEIVQNVKDNGDVTLMVYFDNGAGSQKISLSALNDKEYAAFTDGKAEFAVDKKSVDELLLELDKISKNPIKTDGKG